MKVNKHLDEQLVKAYQSGEQEAITLLVKRWHVSFCERAFWLVKDADISKDVAQETWQTIIAKIHTLQDASSFGSWALRIVYSKSLDVLRKQNSERLKQGLYLKDQVATVEDFDVNIAIKNKVLKAVYSLPEQQQMVVKLFYVENYSLKDISETLNISVGTSKSRLFYAREKLKSLLKKEKDNY